MPSPWTWIDGHLDLAYLAANGRDITAPLPVHVDGCISLPALRAANVELVFATIFTEMNYAGEEPAEPQMYDRDDADAARRAGVQQLEIYQQLERQGQVTIVRGADDLQREAPLPKIVLLMEGADPIGHAEELSWWRERGVRLVGLTWSMGSRYAGGNATGGGLTDEGREMVAALDALGMVHDASHLSEPAFWELLELAHGPVVATHSNSRALCSAYGERNLSDEQIRAIDERAGVIGLNLFTKFLADGRRATVADCVQHVQHICDVVGHRRAVALGSDMDGGFGATQLAQGVESPAHFDALGNALIDAGWSDKDVQGFARRNWLRVVGKLESER